MRVRLPRVSGDIQRAELPELDWAESARTASLSTVYGHARGQALAAERWYAEHRPPKRRLGRWLRVAALLLGAIAALLPILSEIFVAEDDTPVIAPGWASVALAIAAALVAIDRYLGASSAWMRYMTAQMQIARYREDFEYAWNIARSRTADPPSVAEVEVMLTLGRALVSNVNEVVANDTGSWLNDFRGSLQTTEQGLQPRA